MKRFEATKSSAAVRLSLWPSLALVALVEALAPLGVVVWIFFLLPLVLCLFEWRPRLPVLVAALATACIALAFLYNRRIPGFPLWVAALNRGLGILMIWSTAAIVRQFIDSKIRLREQDWLAAGRRELGNRVQGEQSLTHLGENILGFLCPYLEVPVAALYVGEPDGFRRRASYGLGAEQAPELVRPGDSLLGQAIKTKQIARFDDLPPDYLPIASALGRTQPSHVVIVPTEVDGQVNAALEFGFRHPVGRSDMHLLQNVAATVAVAIRSAQYRATQAQLLQETQRQAAELQVQQEELRVTNEELEEQSRALKESQVQLENQQAELEATNSQLEEQTQALEQQRDDLARTQAELMEKADALERANQYKSEFLANMSHELRTPLNSSLILAKLLSDNKDGNLTEEQVKFASTIYASGNDLLSIINDILDLARIEAGRVDINPEPVALSNMLGALERTFQPLAEQKKLDLAFTVDPTVPAIFPTDPLRLQQILRNLLANAIKFTEHGQVSLRVSADAEGRLVFSVRDTGVGIPAEQHETIFEAFRQADGSTHRKYGGSGLGLTISRELARRLGGTLGLASEEGKGSTFTLVLPPAPDATVSRESPAAEPEPSAPRNNTPAAMPAPSPKEQPKVVDDRETLAPGERTILVIEDDERFARILHDLAHELHFRCLVATRAAEGLHLAEQFVPSAIILDVHLPDLSGLSLLEQLKHNGATRHIPVHVVSVNDYTQQAFELGAVGYALKPVKREQLVGAIERIEKRLVQHVRRILIVEDVQEQRESMEALLRRDGVEIVSVGRGHEALAVLRDKTFDCMVLDLTLPDMSGCDVLEKMAAGEAFSFPPVIVYTGRALTREEEMRLRRYAGSVIIKGARSPERLLDEVTLFLHQVESKLPAEQQRILRLVRQREAALEGRTILVVEDDARNIFALSSILEPKGVKLLIARNGQEALDALDRTLRIPQEKVDLVLMDIMMPVMDGLAATRAIRRRPEWKKLPIIALTAKAMADDRQKCIEAGANDYLAKPLDVGKLVSLVKVWLPK